MGRLTALYGDFFRWVNRYRPWHSFWTPIQILNLIALRINLRRFNLHDTETHPPAPTPPPDGVDARLARTPAGSYNDLGDPSMGQACMRFGRNVPLDRGFEEADLPGEPSPRVVSRSLFTREPFIPATTLNILAAGWIQFQVHDWFAHGPNDKSVLYQIPLATDDDWPEEAFTLPRTAPDPTRSEADAGRPHTYQSVNSHWWDGSQLYGSTTERMAALRDGREGRLKLTEDGLLPVNDAGVDDTGFNDNWWIGLTAMHTLFAREHNAICAALAKAHLNLGDDRLYELARMVNSALIAKIHTVEWTPALLNTPALHFGMRANWWGVLGRRFKKRFGRVGGGEILSGIVGSKTDHNGTRFAMTEEFVSVYRMHNLVPDDFRFSDPDGGGLLAETDLAGATGANARRLVDRHGIEACVYSLGIEHPGAITLRNHPRGLQQLFHEKSGHYIDLGAVDILRDRERGVPRYNELRRLLDMPALESVDELTEDEEIRKRLHEVYGDDTEKIDFQVGLFGETPPKGFAFSDTAFRIFILMASRRLKSDRFLTTDFVDEVYTKTGLDWIEETTMADVIARHFPALGGRIANRNNAFAPWRRT